MSNLMEIAAKILDSSVAFKELEFKNYVWI